MFSDLIKFPIESVNLNWEARQVVHDLFGEPHMLMRLKLTGTQFTPRALEAFVTVGKVRSLFVIFAEDELSASAYFDRPLPEGGTVEFGYEHEVLLRFPGEFRADAFERLDVTRLPKNTRLVDRFFGDET